jgi:hypothetical protein
VCTPRAQICGMISGANTGDYTIKVRRARRVHTGADGARAEPEPDHRPLDLDARVHCDAAGAQVRRAVLRRGPRAPRGRHAPVRAARPGRVEGTLSRRRRCQEHRYAGLDQATHALVDVLTGKNEGKAVVVVAEE